MKRAYKVLIVDDHSLFREGLMFLLSNSDLVAEIREAENGRDFIDCIKTYTPDIVLMDIQMPEMDGIAATIEGLTLIPNLNIIALSMYSKEDYYKEMLDAGAKGFLLKNSTFDDVQSAIKEVADGGNYFSPEILSSIVQNLQRNPAIIKNEKLTKRELEVLLNICQGLSNSDIAKKLYISKRTVDKHREHILLKTQSKNTAELVVYAIKNGYFEI